jgi:hypothetical protein
MTKKKFHKFKLSFHFFIVFLLILFTISSFLYQINIDSINASDKNQKLLAAYNLAKYNKFSLLSGKKSA